MPNPDSNTVFSERLRFAWEHFRFHAEQRTRVFHFFLLAVALLLSAFSVLVDNENAKYQKYAYLVLCIGGVLSTMFLSLDVRNVQLLEQSEALLRKMEKDTLYTDWRDEIDGGEIKLGILSREAVLKEYVQSKFRIRSAPFLRWFLVDNIKHKLSIRLIHGMAILGFWIGAYAAAPSTVSVWIFVIGSAVCLAWGYYALRTPQRHLKWEQKALKVLDARNHAGGSGSP